MSAKPKGPKRPAKRSPRVAAWLYTAINPLIESLEREQNLVSFGNLTWRAYSRQPEFVLRPLEYLTANGQLNLQDAQRFYPELGRRLQRHEELRAAAIAAARASHERLVRADDFNAATGSLVTQFKEAPGLPNQYPSTEPLPTVVSQVAERVVNSIDALASHYIDAPFWNFAGNRLKAAAARQELDVRDRVAALSKDTDELLQYLRELRFEICDTYDVPPAPAS